MRSIFILFSLEYKSSLFLSYNTKHAHFFHSSTSSWEGTFEEDKKKQALQPSLAEWHKSPMGSGTIANCRDQRTWALSEVELGTLSQKKSGI